MKKLLFAMLAAFLAMPAGYCQTKDTTGLAQMVSEIINNVEKKQAKQEQTHRQLRGQRDNGFLCKKKCRRI